MIDWAELFEHPLARSDSSMASLIADETARQSRTVNLIASESYCARATLEAEASILVNKNATGYPGHRDVAGCEVADQIERLAQARACALFGAEHANVQAVTSTIANIAVLRGLLQPGDRILSLGEEAGGHHSHGAAYHLSGQDYQVTLFGVDEARQGIDLAAVARLAQSVRPKIIIAGSTAYPRAIDFRGLSAVARSVGAFFFADIAHVAGLVAAGVHENPVPYADVVTTSTHKTFCGPRTGGLILCKMALAEAIDQALFPGIQGAPGLHIIAARAVLFEMVRTAPFRALMREVVRNAKALARGILEAGLPLYLGGTDTHMVVVDLRQQDRGPLAAEQRLAAHGLVANRISLPPQPRSAGALGIRLGATAMTIRGLDEGGFRHLGALIGEVLSERDGGRIDDTIVRQIGTIAEAHPVPAL
jgi:glycine hydroxymethyltransferase